MMKYSFKTAAVLAASTLMFASCIREELPNINVDVTGMSQLKVGSQNPAIIKTSIQENGITMYATSMAAVENIDMDITVSKGATWSFVDVDIKTVPYDVTDPSTGTVYHLTQQDTTIVGEIAQPKDFSVTRYIKVVSAREGVSEDDHKTQELINAQNSMFIGWEKDGVRSKTYSPGAHLYKIWSVKVLPAGIPTRLTFDNWQDLGSFKQPYEIAAGVQSNIWSSTNASIALMSVNPLIQFGAKPTDDAVSGQALLLTSNDIRFAGTPQKPYIAGCCFIGEFDGSDTGALTCTHVGLPFDKKPESLTFWYKFLPMQIKEPGGNFTSMGEYAGKMDRGFIRAVLYRADGDTPWVNGESIRNASHKDVVAYAEFAPEGRVDQYTKQEVKFTYTQNVNEEDMKNWKYNLALYFASSYEGFRFICGADMSSQMAQLTTLNTQYQKGEIDQASFYQQYMGLISAQMGTQLYIDEMEINCK